MYFDPILILVIVLVIVLLIAAVVLFRGYMYGKVPPPMPPVELKAVDAEEVAGRLSQALRFQTISNIEPEKFNGVPFVELRQRLAEMYPAAHARMAREVINEYSLLYTWGGSNPDLDPVLFIAHLDVVPADPETVAEWTHPPFQGEIADGFVWGRGALDIKNTVIGLLDAVELLVKEGFQPARTVYLAFGHDEEVGGLCGAAAIAQHLASQGVKLAAILDEGGPITSGSLPGLSVDAAMLGIAEKGHVSLELSVEGRAGHSSMPTRHTAIGVLAGALARLEAAPMPARMDFANLLFESLGAFLPGTTRLALANQWLFGKKLRATLEASPTTNAMVRTSTAITMIHGGIKDNVLPSRAKAVVNFRLLPGDSIADLMDHVRSIINDDAVLIRLPEGHSWEASPISPNDTFAYDSVSTAVRQVFPDVVVAPFLLPGATDSRHYRDLCSSTFRFSPCVMTPDLLQSVHGMNERIPVEAMGRMVQFYAQLITSWAAD